MSKFSAAIEATRLTNGELPRYSSVGSYPLLYLTDDADCLCAGCVDELDPELEGQDVIDGIIARVNWEIPTSCDECGKEIEAAYN